MEHTNYGLAQFPSDLGERVVTQTGRGTQVYVNYEYSTQARHDVITLAYYLSISPRHTFPMLIG